MGGGLSFSQEYDYTSFGGNMVYSKSLNGGNTGYLPKRLFFWIPGRCCSPWNSGDNIDNNNFKYKQATALLETLIT